MYFKKGLIFILFFFAIGIYGKAEVGTLKVEETTQHKEINLTPFKALVLGFVEGITEFLPISSTGHLILVSELLDVYPDQESSSDLVKQKQSINAYIIIIQAGAILAVLGLYRKKIYTIFLGIIGKCQEGALLARNLALAFLPAALLGVSLKSYIDHYLFGPLPVIIALFLGGILMFFVERWYKQKKNKIDRSCKLHQLSVRQALFIGLCQSVALWPGMSRSMVTLVGGYLCGLSPKHAAQFSFLLGLPTLTAAALYKGAQSGKTMIAELGWSSVLLGASVAAISAAIAVKWMITYLEKYGLSLFAWYRIGLAIIILFVFIL